RNGNAQTTFTINPATTTTMASNTTAPSRESTQDVILTADVSSNGNGVNEGTMTFISEQGSTVLGTATTSGTLSNGQTSVRYALPARLAAGVYILEPVYSDSTGNFL
ncbi:MAG TPA: hypothetical protein VH682_24960, partial [Gemmataceae bacterium]